MNAIGLKIFWCMVQVTIVCAASTVLAALPGRGSGVSRHRVSLVALAVVLSLTAISFCPWPRWKPDTRSTVTVVTAIPVDQLIPDNLEERESGTIDFTPQQVLQGVTGQDIVQQVLTKIDGIVRFVDGLGHRISVILIPVLCLSIAVGAGRYAIGWWAVSHLSCTAKPIADETLLAELQAIRQELGCPRSVDLRASDCVITPSTVGWFRPLILLPPEWHSWSAVERRTVLAHEVAHIVRNDFRSLALAQVSTIFHFYHPLVHGLVSRLRLEQELAADAAAAVVSGGSRKYLRILAMMAIRYEDHPVAWPVRSFLPTSGTFSRRIEMLRAPGKDHHTNRRGAGILAVTAVVAAGILVSGLRPADAIDPQDNQPALRTPILLTPVVGNPDDVKEQSAEEKDRERSMNNMKTLGLAMHNYHAQHNAFPSAVIKGPNGVPHSWRVALLPYVGLKKIYDQYRLTEPWDSPHNKKLLALIPDVYRAPGAAKDSSSTSCYVFTGKGTPFDGDNGLRLRDFLDGTSNTLLIFETKKDIPWTKPEDVSYAEGQNFSRPGGWHEGGFFAVFADGAGHFITDEVAENVLHDVIRPTDGHIVTAAKLHPERVK